MNVSYNFTRKFCILFRGHYKFWNINAQKLGRTSIFDHFFKYIKKIKLKQTSIKTILELQVMCVMNQKSNS